MRTTISQQDLHRIIKESIKDVLSELTHKETFELQINELLPSFQERNIDILEPLSRLIDINCDEETKEIILNGLRQELEKQEGFWDKGDEFWGHDDII